MTRPVDTTSVTDSNGDVINTYNTANGTGLAVRTKINDVFTALRTISAGSGDPSGAKNVVAFQPHINSSTNELKICTAVSGSGVSLTGTFTTIGNITQTNLGLLPKTGGTLTGVLTAATGSTSAPSLNFGDGGTGFYKKSTNQIGLIANQSEIAFFDQNSFTTTNLQATNIKDTSGNNGSTPEQIAQGRAKAWVNFDGTFGTSPFTEANGGIRNAFNVSSISDHGTGRYTITFASAMPNDNYCVTSQAGNFERTTTSNTGVSSDGTRSTTQFRIRVTSGSSNTADKEDINVAFFND